MTSHSPQAEAAALIAEARKYDANTRQRTGQTTTVYGQLADALDSATAALAVKREADRDELIAELMGHTLAWGNRTIYLRSEEADDLADLLLGVIREAPPVEAEWVHPVDVMRAALGVVEPNTKEGTDA